MRLVSWKMFPCPTTTIMSIQRPDFSSPYTGVGEGSEDTALISSLIGELFHGGKSPAPQVPVSLPTPHEGLPALSSGRPAALPLGFADDSLYPLAALESLDVFPTDDPHLPASPEVP